MVKKSLISKKKRNYYCLKRGMSEKSIIDIDFIKKYIEAKNYYSIY